MMEQGDNWGKSSLPTDWRTRRAQQDAYRKALDEQIQERKMMELKEKVKETPQPAVKDPVQHLMPWLTNSNEGQKAMGRGSGGRNNPNNACRNDVDKLIDKATAMPPKQQLPSSETSQPMNTSSEDKGQTYFYGPPPSGPAPFQASSSPNCGESQPNTNATNPNPQVVIPHPNNVAYGYYQSSSIPPPPEYTEGTTYRPDYPYKTNNQNLTPSIMGNPHANGISQQQQGTVTSQNYGQAGGASEYSNQDDTSRSIGNNSIASSTEMSIRRHVSQTSEDTPNPTKSFYRDELSRQIEERKKMDEERKRLEKQEEERLQRKVQEDQERMTREYDEEQRRRKAKEEEKRQQEQDILERTREVQRQEESRRKQEKAQKILLKEQTLRAEAVERLNAEKLAKASMDNPFDSTPIPSLFGMGGNYSEEGQGDSEVLIKKADKPHKVSSLEPTIHHDDIIACIGIGNDILPQKKVVTGLSKSAEECNLTNSPSPLTLEEEDTPTCSKCSKSYSSDNVKLCEEAEQKRLEGVQFLNEVRSALVAEKQKVDERIKARKEYEAAYKAKGKRIEFAVQF